MTIVWWTILSMTRNASRKLRRRLKEESRRARREEGTPVNTVPTLEKAVDEFVDSDQLHLKANSNARFVDPRECRACVETFENMVQALRGPRPRVVPENADDDLDGKIVRLF